jgi:hypothetical protein
MEVTDVYVSQVEENRHMVSKISPSDVNAYKCHIAEVFCSISEITC